MKFIIKHESRGRLRVQLCQSRMTLAQADLLQAWLHAQPHVLQADVHERTCCAVVTFRGDCREQLLSSLRRFSYSDKAVQAFSGIQSGRAINRAYQEKLVGLVCGKAARSLFLPAPLQAAWAVVTAVPYVLRGLGCLIRRQMHVELLDGLSIGISLVRRDFGTAGSVMFLLRLGELLEEWTHKRSVDNLARSMSLNIDRVWLKTPGGDEILVPLTQVQPGDRICVRTGGMIPLDSVVDQGEVTVNQASLTGESIPVPKRPGSAVYAGTVVEEGECVLLVRQHSGSSRYDKIVSMIEKAGYLDHVIFISFALKNLISRRRRYPTQPAQYLIKEWDDKLLDTLEKYNLGIDIYYKSATPDNVRKVHALGQEYNVWTVNEAVDGDAMVAMGVDYITTNILEGTNKAE